LFFILQPMRMCGSAPNIPERIWSKTRSLLSMSLRLCERKVSNGLYSHLPDPFMGSRMSSQHRKMYRFPSRPPCTVHPNQPVKDSFRLIAKASAFKDSSSVLSPYWASGIHTAMFSIFTKSCSQTPLLSRFWATGNSGSHICMYKTASTPFSWQLKKAQGQ